MKHLSPKKTIGDADTYQYNSSLYILFVVVLIKQIKKFVSIISQNLLYTTKPK